MIFLTLLLTFIFLTVAYWLLAADYTGNAGRAGNMVVVSIATLYLLQVFFHQKIANKRKSRQQEPVHLRPVSLAGGSSRLLCSLL